MYYILENFINYCEKMEIANEGTSYHPEIAKFKSEFINIMKEKGITSSKSTFQIKNLNNSLIKNGKETCFEIWIKNFDPVYDKQPKEKIDSSDKLYKTIKSVLNNIKSKHTNIRIDEEEERHYITFVICIKDIHEKAGKEYNDEYDKRMKNLEEEARKRYGITD